MHQLNPGLHPCFSFFSPFLNSPQGPHSHILMIGWGGGGGPKDFFRCEILSKGDFLGSMEDAEIFWVAKKKEGFFGVAKKELREVFGYAKKGSDFFG